eukprot:TRINITY_DN2402_c0_g3_i1.p1 TRINITY_DN2402_c0_g3~~TRINITY_DN2402_c0_g3_i1.p1  ORF type:complete len:262 (+),score=37.52 TRINITY_DN2402_c0_g3_i1:76-861(+)
MVALGAYSRLPAWYALYASGVCWSSGAAALDCHEELGDVVRWSSDGVEYVIQDHHGRGCSQGCHIMSAAACRKAVLAYHELCPTDTTNKDDAEVHIEYWGGTGGCHVQTSESHISFQFNCKWEQSGEGQSDDHHPLCMINASKSDDGNSSSSDADACDLGLQAEEKCEGVGGPFGALFEHFMLIMQGIVVVAAIIIMPISFWSCCHDWSKGCCPPRWAGLCRGGCCCSKSRSHNASQPAAGGHTVVGLPVTSAAPQPLKEM